MKFFYDSTLNVKEADCFKDPYCSECRADGKCRACHTNFKLNVALKCVCKEIDNCLECTPNKDVCNKCD